MNANENEVKKMLSIELLKSFIVFDSVRIKQFDRESFEKDVTFFLGAYRVNKYLYNGKELQEELGQLDYDARFYDPVIG